MPMTVIFVFFLMVSFWSLVSASQQWNARRDAHGVAAAAARAAAQGDAVAVRSGGFIDADLARARAAAILDAAGHEGAVTIDGLRVTVTVSSSVDYAFPAPGFARTVTATSTAELVRGVAGVEAP